ncbi:MAG: DUF554 domain-containing protein [Candidatus Limivicinus sp.]|jgi:uncharacterized membrane protein YqgA involved in biofilm formation
MLATIVNAAGIILGGLIGSFFGAKISKKYTGAIMTVMALICAVIGIQGAAGTKDILLVVLCLVLGTVLGAALNLDERINKSGDKLKAKLSGTKLGRGRFADAFVTASLLFGVGTMAILGSIQAGLNHDYSILFTKTVMDFASAVAFSAALGPGVIFSALPVFIFQGAVTLLAGAAEPYLGQYVIDSMTAVGGPIFIAMSVNLLGLREERIKVGDMLPAILLPIIYVPLSRYIVSLF